MFCLRGETNGDTKFKEILNQDDFGWWLSDEDDLKSPTSARSKDRLSLGSSESMFSCIDSDDTENYFLAQEFKQECKECNYEKIELTSLIHENLDLNLIEQDAIRKESDVTPFLMEDERYSNDSRSKPEALHGMCYTPERLVRSQEYRILAPSPRYLSISQPKIVQQKENLRKGFCCRRQLNCFTDSKQPAMQLKSFAESRPREGIASTIGLHGWKDNKRIYNDDVGTKSNNENETKMEDVSDYNKSCSLRTPDSISKRSSYDKLNITWEDCGKMGTRSSSLDTSGIQSNDWSSDTHSDMQNTFLCLSDELATTDYKLDNSQERCTAINEVVSILEELDVNPEKATILLEEDRFCDSTSTHDQLTRLALTTETDANVLEVLENPEHLVKHLQNKIKKLQISNKDIYRDIFNLRESFQCDEQRITDILSDTNKLRQDVHELRYLDDLLKLLRGELERISKRNWPFVIGHTNHSEEMNLIV